VFKWSAYIILLKITNLNLYVPLFIIGFSSHSKKVFCLVDPKSMEDLNFSVEDIPVELCTHIVIETRFVNNTIDLFEELDMLNAPPEGI